MYIRSALFWDIVQHRVVILYRRFGTTHRSHLQGSNRLSRNVGTEMPKDFLTLEDGADKLSRNFGTELRLYAAWCPRRAQKKFLTLDDGADRLSRNIGIELPLYAA
jgi:hypothetical protein